MRKTLTILASLAICQGCGHAPSSRGNQQPEIVVDFATKTATSPEWTVPLTDCSDAQFQCLEAAGRFLIAFPRTCPTDQRDWVLAGYQFRNTAPAVHYGLPSGGYYSEKYPNVHLSYRKGVGFISLSVRENPVPTENWGGSSLAEYALRFVGQTNPFVCR